MSLGLPSKSSYFSDEASVGTKCFYYMLFCTVIVYTLVSLCAPIITPVCDIPLAHNPQHPPKGRALIQGLEGGLEDAPNPSYRVRQVDNVQLAA